MMRLSQVFISCIIFCLASISNNVVKVEATHNVYMHLQSAANSSGEVDQLHRTGYHFQPPRFWMNDPNGPMLFNGVYHLFYQYNPNGSVWGHIVWAHSVSKDLINWKRLDYALIPSQKFDLYGCWSGSATVLPGNRPVLLYTGVIDANNTQVQNHAIPANLSDPYLQNWTKPDNNPIITADVSINKTAFRDPTTAWFGQDRHWRIAIGGLKNNTGIAHLYRSKDFVYWTKAQHPLHSVAGTGNWECPDFYPVLVNGSFGLDTSAVGPNVKHVLKVSLDLRRYEYYTIGTYSSEVDKYVPDEGMIEGSNGMRYDYGNFYASKSFFDPSTNRRILWAWANESDSTADDINKGWSGIQLIPRTILLDPNGKQLVQWPIQELEKLRGEKVELSNKQLVKGDKVEIQGITAAQADVDVTFTFDSLDQAEPFDPTLDRYDAQKICSQRDSTVEGGLGPFGLVTLASENLEEYTPVFFRVFEDQNKHLVLLCSDASRSSLEGRNGTYRPSFAGFVDVDLTGMKLSLRSLIDNSVVESFGAGGKTCISSRVYPTLAIYGDAHLYAFNNGTETITIDSLNAWSMNRPSEMNQ